MTKHIYQSVHLPFLKANTFLLFSTLLLASLTSQAQTVIGGVNLGNLPNYLFFFADGSNTANWQGATKGFAGNVAIDGISANEKTSGGVPHSGTIYTNASTLGAWASIVDQNDPNQVIPAQAFGVTNQTALIAGLETDLNNAFAQINALAVSSGFSSVSSTSLNGLNKQNGVAETFVINVTSGLGISSKINITGDAGDVFILRWDSDGNPNNGYQGTVKFQSGGAIVPLGGLKPSNFIHVAGNMNASGGGGTPAAPYPQGPKLNDGTGTTVVNGSNFSGGGFFTGYWLSTGDPVSGETSPFSNAIFVGGWYTTSKKFSMTSGTSGVYVAPNVPPPPSNNCIGEAANYVILGLQGGNISINSATNIIGDVGYSAGVTSSTNQKAGDDGQFTGTVYVHTNVGQFSYAAQNFLPSGGVVQNNSTQSARLDQANASAGAASANFSALQPNVVYGSLGDNDSKTINRVGNVTVVQIGSLDYKEDQLTLVGQPGQNDAFVINVLGNFFFSGSKIVLQNVSPNMVVFNFPNASTISLNKASNNFNGTILAPTGSVEYHNPAVFNGGIIAKNITLHSDFNITAKPLQIPCTSNLSGSLGDCVWNDLDKDGIKDANEPGVPNVTVQLRNCQDQLLATTQTNATGFYSFPTLQAGCYRVCVALPSGFQFTLQNVGNDANDSDVAASGCSGDIDLSPGENDPTNDAGIFQSSQPDCQANINISISNGVITITGLDGAPVSSVQLFNVNNEQVFSCFGNCGATVTLPVVTGKYTVVAKYYTSTNSQICQKTQVVKAEDICVNVTNGGTIGFGEGCETSFVHCPANGAAPVINSCTPPTGGTGNLEIVWLKNTSSSSPCQPPTTTAEQIANGQDPHWTMIPGATSLTLNPGTVTQNTCYLRCVRRSGCSTFIESNIISLTIAPNCGGGGTPDCNNIGITPGNGGITVSGIDGAPVTSVQIFNDNWTQELHNCLGNCASPTATFSVPPGTYNVVVKYYTAAPSTLICEKTQTVGVTRNAQGQQGEAFQLNAIKGEELTELYWIHNGGYHVEQYVLERSANGVDFEAIRTQVSAGGQSHEFYQDYDIEPLVGDNFYRVKMVNTDGSTGYSEVQKVNFPDLVDYTIFPNPANDFAKLNLETVVGKKDVTITILNNLGLEVKRFEVAEVWSKYYLMDIRELQEGHYIIWLNVPGKRLLARSMFVSKI